MSKKNIQTIYPATRIQCGMLFHTLSSPGSGVYVPQHAIELEAEIDPQVFDAAWRLVIERHDVFRTAFINLETDKPLQVVLRDVAVPVQHLDWRDADAVDHEVRFSRLLHDQWTAPFDLVRAPLMRICLVRLGQARYRLVWTYHHAILDGWSGPIVLGEFFRAYEALAHGQSPTLPSATPFVHYIRWLQRQNEEGALAYWKELLDSPEPATGWNEVFAVSPRRADAGQYDHSICVDETVTEALENVARNGSVTLNVVVQAAVAVLLKRFHNVNDVVFGATVSGRPADLDGVEAIVGQFINTLPVRARVADDSALGPLLTALQQQYVRSNENAFVPLAHIQRTVRGPHNPSLFETLLVFENYPVSAIADDQNASARHLHSVSQNNYPLSFVVVPGKRMSVILKYSPETLWPQHVERIGCAFVDILTRIAHASAPETLTVSDLLLPDPQARDNILAASRGPTKPVVTTFAAALRETVEMNPERNAVSWVAGDALRSVTYRELYERSGQLCGFLAEEGIRPGQRVGICLHPSDDLVIAVIACLRMGVGFVPLDPDQPIKRISSMADTAGLSAAITVAAHADRFSQCETEITQLDLKADADLIAESGVPVDLPVVPSASEAYVIFTSGSTGEPKGVSVSHGALMNYSEAVASTLDLAPDASLTALTSFAADLGYTALFGALATGRTLRLCNAEYRLNAHELAQQFQRHPVDCLKIVPSHLAALLDGDGGDGLLPRRQLVFGGEKLDPSLVERIHQLRPDLRVFNHYGPTETTVGALVLSVEPSGDGTSEIALGEPLANVNCYVLSGQCQLAPVEQLGELAIGGSGVAHGYLSRPGLTAARFLPDPYSDAPGARMYVTGDRARLTTRGQFCFHGRVDDQVKIRGFRVEPGEIQSVMEGLTGVAECVVVCRERDEINRLVAYVCGDHDQESEIRAALVECLPEALIPSQFVWLKSLPRTGNGKIDRAALPAPELGSKTAREPKTRVQRQVAEVWCSVLGLKAVGVDENFFDVGGDSLMMIRLHRQLCDALQVELTITDLFQYPTIERLATRIDAGAHADNNGATRRKRASAQRQAVSAAAIGPSKRRSRVRQ